MTNEELAILGPGDVLIYFDHSFWVVLDVAGRPTLELQCIHDPAGQYAGMRWSTLDYVGYRAYFSLYSKVVQ